MTQNIVLDWAQKRPNENEATRSARIMYLQHFAVFLNSQGYCGYISAPQKYHYSQHNAYVFTKDEIHRLFSSLDNMTYSPISPYRHIAFPLLYRMLYGCGFRISELLNLTVGDVDLENGIIHVRDAKMEMNVLFQWLIAYLSDVVHMPIKYIPSMTAHSLSF